MPIIMVMKKYIMLMLFSCSCLFSQELRSYNFMLELDDHSSFDYPYNVVPEPATYIQAGVFAGMGTAIWLLKKNKKRS